MNNFLSIGELAKLRNVNVQSLRYYEKLGILVPAYINPENGYRYYSLDQIMILDTIILCIDLGIPLKDLKNYVNTEGVFCKTFLHKIAKTFCRSLQLHFVGNCKPGWQGTCQSYKRALQTFFKYFTCLKADIT